MPPQETRVCQNCKVAFNIEADDFTFYEKIGVPPPTRCFSCRLQRRMLWRNERNYYRRTCDLCKKSIIAVYPADAPFPVYCHKCWWSDNWDPLSYGKDFDFTKTFFEQYRDFKNTVPALSVQNDDGAGSVNCEWSYDWAFSKNCYLGACGWYVENGSYMYCANYDKDVVDIWDSNNSELLYEAVLCERCYGSKYCTLCFDCNNCTLAYDLRGCSNCVMCVGLRNKQYHILNQPYSKEDYEKKVREMNLGSRSSLEKLKAEFQRFVYKYPRKFAYNLKTTNSTGDVLLESKNVRDSFYVLGPAENSRFLVIIDRAKDSYDCNNTGNPELCYESVTPDNSRGNKATVFCWKCTDAEYSDNCHSCVSVLGCAGLKHKTYAILNKSYSKEEFFELRTRIIEHMKKNGEWGEFFPAALSPFAYNETAAQEWFPLTEEDVIGKGYRWKEPEKRHYSATKHPGDIPDIITGVGDDFINEIIECAHAADCSSTDGGGCNHRCTQAFRIIPQELSLYRKLDIPIPALCPNCRHYERLEKRNLPKSWKRTCDCNGTVSKSGVYQNTATHEHGAAPCGAEFQTSYSPEKPDIVYCEACYNTEIA